MQGSIPLNLLNILRSNSKNIHDIAIKLSRANNLFFTIRNYVNKHILRTTYFVIFDSHINRVISYMGPKPKRIVILQKKSLRIFSLETLAQFRYSNPTIFSNLKTKYLYRIYYLSINYYTTFLQ